MPFRSSALGIRVGCAWIALSAWLGCAHEDVALQQELALLQRSLSIHEVALDRALEKTGVLERGWSDVARRFEAADRDFEAAEHRYQAASQAPRGDARALAEAAKQ
jgi:hypothetical protein